MHKYARAILPLLLLLAFSSCNVLKFVPEDKYLLNKTKVVVEDTKAVTHDDLKKYLQQRQNSEIFGFWKLQLQVYSSAGLDSTKWINRTLKKMGEAPEVFDPSLAQYSMEQLTRAMFNKGYFDASVDTTMVVKKRKLKLIYHVTAREPYTLTSYNVKLQQADLKKAATGKHCKVKEGMLLDADVLNEERERITNRMRRKGYYYFEKDYLHYVVDSAFDNHTVTAQLCLRDYVQNASDSLKDLVFRQFTIRDVNFYTDFDPNQEGEQEVFTETEEGYSFSYVGRKLLRPHVLKARCAIEPGKMYNVDEVERTYAEMSALAPVKYVDISFEQVSNDQLSCTIVLSRGKLNSVSAEVEGTYSAGAWGILGGLGYSNRNLFHGAEEFSLSGNGGYEWRQDGGRAIEAKAEASLKFVSAPKISVSYQYQKRPDEFTRTIANAGLSYHLTPYKSQWQHHFNLIDISYVYLPWISDDFASYFLNSRNLLRYSYQDHLIMSWSYGGSYTTFRKRSPYRPYFTFNYNVETAGNFLYGMSKLFKQEPNEDGSYNIFKVRYSQYAKGDLAFTYNGIINKKHRVVTHAALGVAVPFGNSTSLPFEKRYFAGGANSVRGWTVRSLGPGAYHGNGDRIDYNNQAGDIKIDLSLEYRWRFWSIFELAAFTDAGNIWTIREYESQPYGVFKWDEFYKQLGWSYGVGLRLDLSFFVFRVDFGVKLYDPSRIYYDQKQWRTVPNGLCWKDDMTFHFAIGYPF